MREVTTSPLLYIGVLLFNLQALKNFTMTTATYEESIRAILAELDRLGLDESSREYWQEYEARKSLIS